MSDINLTFVDTRGKQSSVQALRTETAGINFYTA